MTLLNLVIIVALLATVFALGTGIVSMVRGGEFDRKHATELMLARIVAQAVAFVALLVALLVAST